MIAIICLSSFVNFLNKFNFNFIVINVSFSLNSLHCVSNNISCVMQCNTMMSIIFIIPRFIMLKYEVFGTFMTGVFKTINSTGGSLLHTSPITFINLKFHNRIIFYFISCFISCFMFSIIFILYCIYILQILNYYLLFYY